jgi:hypothetical protein
MSTDQRRAMRTTLRAGVKLSHPEVGDLDVHTGDISESGVYILTEGKASPSIGELVLVQVQGMGGGDAPVVKMRVVRSDANGIGLEFVEE